MKKRWKWKLIAFFAVLASVLLLGGCKFQYTLEEKREETGMNACVTYYTNGNGAYFGTDVTMKKLYLADGSVAINIGVDRVTNGTIPTPTRSNYTLLGWYEAETDDNGNPLKDETTGEVVLKKQAFDFKYRLQDGDDIVLYAKWQRNEAVNVYLICDEMDTPFVVDGVTLNNKDFLKSYNYQSNNQRPMPGSTPTVAGYTAFDFYMDEACTQKVAWPLVRDRDGDCKIYLKYIKGDWTILRDAESVQAMFTSTATRNYYLANDIDCDGETMKASSTFNSNLQGNGYTIKNLNVSAGSIKDMSVAMFGKLGAKAKIENVTFENVKLSCSLATDVHAEAYLFFSSTVSGATISSVTLKGNLTIDVKREKSGILDNMVKNNAWVYTNVLFGGYATDEEALNSALGITVDSEANVSVVKDVDDIVVS